MNWKKHILNLAIPVALLTACDSFTDDVAPTGDEALALQGGIYAVPNASIFIDLKRTINTDEVVQFQIATTPQKGAASISSEAILEYIPNENFISGQDFLSLDLINESGSTIDTDTLVINMTNPTDSIPCFNGAISDYYTADQDSSVMIYPIGNDGFCPEEVSTMEMAFCEQPENGDLISLSSLQYGFVYIPNPGFNGIEEFMYSLTLTDMDGNEHYSIAKVTIEVLAPSSGGCDSLVRPFTHILPDSLDIMEILPYIPQAGCDVSSWTVDIVSVESGSAEVTPTGMIRYYRGTADTDKITYDIQILGESVRNWISIEYETVTCTAMPEAEDDFYPLFVVSDSIGTAAVPYSLNVAQNDSYCGAYTLELLSQPDFGVAQIEGSPGTEYVSYHVVEEFESDTNTSFTYKTCDGNGCDQATVSLTVSK